MSVLAEELEGAAAIRFAEQHLKQVRIDAEKWETEFVHVETGEVWILDYPASAQHGGGSPRLRKKPRNG